MRVLARAVDANRQSKPTLQSVNSPLLKLLKRDLGRGRRVVQVQTVRVFLLLVDWCGKLSLFRIDDSPAF